jgi:hypothetical protein
MQLKPLVNANADDDEGAGARGLFAHDDDSDDDDELAVITIGAVAYMLSLVDDVGAPICLFTNAVWNGARLLAAELDAVPPVGARVLEVRAPY